MLLIDEIDKADVEFPNDILRELDRMEFYYPEPAGSWHHIASVPILRELVAKPMFPLTLQGLDSAIAELRRTLQLPLRAVSLESTL